MKPVRISIALAALLSAAPLAVVAALPAEADCRSSCSIFGSFNDGSARIASRQDLRDADAAITTRGGEVTLLLTRDVIAVQLSDRTLKKIRRELRDSESDEEEDGMLAQIIRTAVFSIVQNALTHSIEYPVRELRDVSYEDGELVLLTNEGERLFGKMEVNDAQVCKSFSEEEARDFVREFHRIKGSRGRASL